MKILKILILVALALIILSSCQNNNMDEVFLNENYLNNFNNILTEKEIEFYINMLSSSVFEEKYVAINRLVESYNYPDLRKKSVEKISPFLNDPDARIKESAEFILNLLNNEFNKINSDYFKKRSNGSYIFTVINNLFDYGSYNKVYIISNNSLDIFLHLNSPHEYIKNFILSPDKNNVLFFVSSRKSNYLFSIYNNDSFFTPELVDTVRIQYAKNNNIDFYQRSDYENYSEVVDVDWQDNNTLLIKLNLAYDGGEATYSCSVIYDILNNTIIYN